MSARKLFLTYLLVIATIPLRYAYINTMICTKYIKVPDEMIVSFVIAGHQKMPGCLPFFYSLYKIENSRFIHFWYTFF